MEISSFANPEIQITSVYFRNKPGQQRLQSYPKRMVYQGQEYTFMEDGLRYLVHKGQQLINLFDVTDGQNSYRLRLDDTDHWTLVGMKAVA